VLRHLLSQFTIIQSSKLGAALTNHAEFGGQYWNPQTQKWKPLKEQGLFVSGQRILLVPKIIVRKTHIITSSHFLQQYALPQRQQFHLENRTELTHWKYSKERGDYLIPPSKKEVHEAEVAGRCQKEYNRKFAEANPKIVDDFRTHRAVGNDGIEHILSDEELDSVYCTTTKSRKEQGKHPQIWYNRCKGKRRKREKPLQ